MNPGAGPECEKIRRVLLVCELWRLFVSKSLINCGAFEADELLTKPNCTKNRREDIQVLQKVVVAIGITARRRQKSTQKLEFCVPHSFCPLPRKCNLSETGCIAH